MTVHSKDRKSLALETLAKEIREAREQVKRGETYSQEEVMKMFGIVD